MSKFTIGKKTKIDKSVIIGPYSIIEDAVEIGAQTKIGSHVFIKRDSIIGNGNVVHSGVHIGVEPQDYHFKGEDTRCIIGNNNVIREYVTISRATGEGCETIIGDNNFIMTYVHVAHNTRIGNNVVISSGAQLGGYVEINDFANIGGLAGVHQFCRIGKHAMLGAKSYLNKDLPPYLLARGNRAKVYGVNIKGLLHNSFSWNEIESIKNLIRIIYSSNYNLAECVDIIKKLDNKYGEEFTEFINTSRRGILLKIEPKITPEVLSSF